MVDAAHLIAAPFLHVDRAHLVTNVVVLAGFAPYVGRALGWWRLCTLCLASGVLANAGAAAWIGRPVIGASGAIAAVAAAHLVLHPRSRLAPYIALWIALQLVFSALVPDLGGVAWPAHMLGALIGAGFAWRRPGPAAPSGDARRRYGRAAAVARLR